MSYKASLTTVLINGCNVAAKDCSKCFKIKPLSEFNKRANGLGGKDSRCRECFNKLTKERKAAYDAAYRVKNQAKIEARKKVWWQENRVEQNKKRSERYFANRKEELENMREYRIKNADKLREYHRGYYSINKDKILEYRRINAEKISEYRKRYYTENKERFAERWARYFEENKEQIRERQRQYYRDNAEEVRQRWREYYRSDKGQIASRRASHRRRERESLTEINFSEDEWLFCLEFFESKCAYCGLFDDDLTMDHFVPVAQLGSFTSDNIVPACSSCNSSKRDSDFFEWFRKQEFYSLDREQAILGYIFDREDEKLKIS